jgi:hypothetical protein
VIAGKQDCFLETSKGGTPKSTEGLFSIWIKGGVAEKFPKNFLKILEIEKSRALMTL